MNRAEALFEALLEGDMTKAAQLSPWTKAVLDIPDLTPEDEALLDQKATRLSLLNAPVIAQEEVRAQPEVEPEPEPEPAPAPEPEPEVEVEPEPEATPATVDDRGSLPNTLHDEVPTQELKLEKKPGTPSPEAFRADFGFMFNSDAVIPDAYRIVLALKYQENWLDWEPETLWHAIREDFGPFGDVARGKIMALRTCLKTNTPWIDWDAFEHVSQAFNDGLVIFGLMQQQEIEEVAYTVAVMRRLGDWPFGAEVSGYIAAACLEAGLVYAPEEWFPSAQYFMDKQSKAPPQLRKFVGEAWEKLKNVNLSAVEWRDSNPVDNQVKKLWSVKTYLDGKLLQPEAGEGDTLQAGGPT